MYGLLRARGGWKLAADLVEHVQDVLARPERVLAKVGTRTVRVSPLFGAERDAVGPPRLRAGDGVIGPWLRGVGRTSDHLLVAGSIRAVGDRTLDEIARPLRGLGRWLRQPERNLILEDDRQRRAGVLARDRARRTRRSQPAWPLAVERERHGREAGPRLEDLHREPLGIDRDSRHDVELERSTVADQHVAAVPQQPACLDEGQVTEEIVQGQRRGRLASGHRSIVGCPSDASRRDRAAPVLKTSSVTTFITWCPACAGHA